jgi:hypothetical protein
MEETPGLKEWYGKTKLTIKGHLMSFRGVENVWDLLLTKDGEKRVSIKIEPDEKEHQVDAIKITAMTKKREGEK